MFSPIEIINKKKRNIELTEEEIEFMVKGYTNDTIPDYQMSAFLMAVYFNNMTSSEVAHLTNCMVESGETVDLSFIDDYVVDKHSTGGVGDKVSIIVIPLVASLNIPIIKMSGKGLGHTGGTIDKLEAIEGFKTELTDEQLLSNIKNYKMALIGQTKNIVPADKKIYALRDVTGTVDSLPLIASSIMSKKIATGVDGVVLDVKVGDGAFMKTVEEARELSNIMINIGKHLNKQVVAILTSMNQPLGKEIGNITEVQEAVKLLKNEEYDNDLMEVSLEVAAQMAKMSSTYQHKDITTIKERLKTNIINNNAYEKFCELVQIQGGNIDSIFTQKYEDVYVIKSDKEGYVNIIKTEELGYIASQLGAGRITKDDKIDYHAGITLEVKIGQYVTKDQVLIRARTGKKYSKEIENRLLKAIHITDNEESVPTEPVILDIISGN